MRKRRVLIIGTSHTRAISDALIEQHVERGADMGAHWLQQEQAGRSVGDLSFQEALETVAALESDDLFVLSIYGTLHNVFGLLVHEYPFWIAAGK